MLLWNCPNVKNSKMPWMVNSLLRVFKKLKIWLKMCLLLEIIKEVLIMAGWCLLLDFIWCFTLFLSSCSPPFFSTRNLTTWSTPSSNLVEEIPRYYLAKCWRKQWDHLEPSSDIFMTRWDRILSIKLTSWELNTHSSRSSQHILFAWQWHGDSSTLCIWEVK